MASADHILDRIRELLNVGKVTITKRAKKYSYPEHYSLLVEYGLIIDKSGTQKVYGNIRRLRFNVIKKTCLDRILILLCGDHLPYSTEKAKHQYRQSRQNVIYVDPIVTSDELKQRLNKFFLERFDAKVIMVKLE